VCANLECILLIPKIILFSFNIEIYGRWYNPASGLLTLLKIINKKVDIEEMIKNKIILLLNLSTNFDLIINIRKIII